MQGLVGRVKRGLPDADGEHQGHAAWGTGTRGGRGGLCRAVGRQRPGRGPRRADERGWEPGPGLLPSCPPARGAPWALHSPGRWLRGGRGVCPGPPKPCWSLLRRVGGPGQVRLSYLLGPKVQGHCPPPPGLGTARGGREGAVGVRGDHHPSLPPVPGGLEGRGQREVTEAGGEEAREESRSGSRWGQDRGEWAGAAGEGRGLQAEAGGREPLAGPG